MIMETDFRISALRLEEKYMGADNSELLDVFGFSAEHAANLEDVERSIFQFVAQNIVTGTSEVGEAVWALGKTCKDDYMTLYQSVMKAYIDHDINVVYQAGISLENLGIRIFESCSPTENVDLTKEKALKYLREVDNA